MPLPRNFDPRTDIKTLQNFIHELTHLAMDKDGLGSFSCGLDEGLTDYLAFQVLQKVLQALSLPEERGLQSKVLGYTFQFNFIQILATRFPEVYRSLVQAALSDDATLAKNVILQHFDHDTLTFIQQATRGSKGDTDRAWIDFTDVFISKFPPMPQ